MPEKGWKEATYYISREVIDALHSDERNLIESCFVLPYLDNEVCSYILGIRSAFSILVRLEEKLIIRKRDSIYENNSKHQFGYFKTKMNKILLDTSIWIDYE